MTRTMDKGLLGVKGESNLDISCSQWKYYLVIISKLGYCRFAANQFKNSKTTVEGLVIASSRFGTQLSDFNRIPL